jgi:hypothetical protein
VSVVSLLSKTTVLYIYKIQETHYISATKPNRLTLCMETVVVYCNTLCGQNVEFIILNHMVHIVTTGLYRVKVHVAE